MIRLFVALDLPEEVSGALAAVPVGEGWRRVSEGGLHVTLAFLGWRSEEDVELVDAAVGSALVPGGLGELVVGEVVLLPPRRPRVMAVRLDDPGGGSVALQSAVSDALAAAGLYEPERRAWLPHVTIARARGPVSRRAPAPPVEPLRFTPVGVTLYRSVLARGGAQYVALERYAV